MGRCALCGRRVVARRLLMAVQTVWHCSAIWAGGDDDTTRRPLPFASRLLWLRGLFCKQRHCARSCTTGCENKRGWTRFAAPTCTTAAS